MNKQLLAAFYREMLSEEGYITRLDNDGDVIFEYNEGTYCIAISERDLMYFMLLFPNFWSIDSPEERINVYRAITHVNSKFHVGKLIITRENVTGSIELLFEPYTNVKPFFFDCIEILREMTREFRQQMLLSVGSTGGDTPGPAPVSGQSQLLAAYGSFIVAATTDSRIFVANIANISASRRVIHSNLSASILRFSPNGSLIACVTRNNQIIVWDANEWSIKYTISGIDRTINAIEFSDDEEYLVGGGNDKTLRVWNASTGESVCTGHGHTDWIRAIAVHPSERYVFSGGDDKVIRCWEMTTGRSLWSINAHTDWIRAMVVCHDGAHIVTASDDKTVKIWRISDRSLVTTISAFTDWVRVLVPSPLGTIIAAGDDDGYVRIFRGVDGQIISELPGHQGLIKEICWSSDGSMILVSSTQGQAKLWRILDNTAIGEFTYGSTTRGIAFAANRRAFALNDDSIEYAKTLSDFNRSKVVEVLI